MFYLYPLILAFALSAILTPLIKKVATKFKIVDHPGQRKIHQKATPLLGGIAIYLAFFITTIVFWSFGFIADDKISFFNVNLILLAGLMLIIGGSLDDKFDLNPILQIIFPVISILIILISGIRIQFVTNPFGGVIEFSIYAGILLSFFWLLGMIYTTKLLDGLDGLVSGITIIGSVIIFIVSLFWDTPYSGTSILSLILVGATFGFLLYNWHPAKIFLGEGGSVFCGFMLGVLSIISGSKIATALLIMGIPILDVIWVIIRRIISKKSLTAGDNKHLHFRLLDIGFSHRQAVIFLYSITTIFGITSIFLHSKGKIIALLILGLFMILLALSSVVIYKKKSLHEAQQ